MAKTREQCIKDAMVKLLKVRAVPGGFMCELCGKVGKSPQTIKHGACKIAALQRKIDPKAPRRGG